MYVEAGDGKGKAHLVEVEVEKTKIKGGPFFFHVLYS